MGCGRLSDYPAIGGPLVEGEKYMYLTWAHEWKPVTYVRPSMSPGFVIIAEKITPAHEHLIGGIADRLYLRKYVEYRGVTHPPAVPAPEAVKPVRPPVSAPAGGFTEDAVTWVELGERLQRSLGILAREEPGLSGADAYAAALHRVISGASLGVVSARESSKLIEAHAAFDRRGREIAEEKVEELRAELRDVKARQFREVGAEMVAAVKVEVDRIPGKLKRAGAELVLTWLGGRVAGDDTPPA